MGCVESSAVAKKVSPKGSQGAEGSGKRLLEEYSVGATLGEGAFGVVSNCTKRSTGEQFAVKMVDKVETPVEAIKKEAEMLENMEHPNIVKFHGVFYERCFVCIVMDKYSGGDLVEGLQKHLKERGQISCHNVVHVAQQMGSGIQYMHAKMVVHRDIKGDNYLMSVKDITEPRCKIVLTDFGTAVTIKPGERLSSGVGTKIFWSPEFYDRDYSLKVDVWAMGVIMYGLVSGRFPFKDQNDIKTKEVKIPKRTHPICEDYIKAQLHKKESDRMSAEQVMQHQWIVTNGMSKQAGAPGGDAAKEATAEEGEATGLREDLLNDGRQERRQELIDRLNREHDARGRGGGGKKKSQLYREKTFSLPDKMMPGATFKYEWWNREKINANKLLELEKVAKSEPETIAKTDDVDSFKQMLKDHRINPDLFGIGKAKSLQQLAGEVQSGACRLMLDATDYKKLVRVVDVVVFRLLSPGTSKSRLLIETEECFPDGRKRETNRLPGTKKEPHENAKQTAERILEEMLNINKAAIQFDLSSVVRYEEEIESPSYPGVRTVYRKEIVLATIVSTDTETLTKVGLPGFTTWNFTDKAGNKKIFNWLTEDGAKQKKVKLKAEGAEVVSTLVRAPIGMNEEQLATTLTQSKIDIAKYGQPGKTKTLKEFAAELVRGESTITRDKDGQLLRVVDVVLLIISDVASADILVQIAHEKQDGHKSTLNRLPGAKCRPDENQFLSARRILRRQLDIDENEVRLVTAVLYVEEEKPTDFYPGLKTVYRKRLIKAEVDQQSA